jgi:hypothetical protein
MYFYKKVINTILPFFAPVLWLFAIIDLYKKKLLIGNKKRILFISQNCIAADHIKLILNLFKEDDNLHFFVTNDKFNNVHYSREDIEESLQIPYINVIQSLSKYWDLIIYVNHPWGFALYFPPFIKKIYINHGICTGKINNDKGEDGVYGSSRVIRPYNKPFYNFMFSSSFFEKNQAIKATPQLNNRILVTGFLRADLLFDLQNKNRAEIRRKLGYTDKQFLIHIISTWGPHSLFQTLGEELLLEAVNLSSKYKFQFSLHPRHDEFGDIKGRKRADILKRYSNLGIDIVDDLAWDEYVVAADLAISDHTSIGLYYLLLNKPLILVPINSEAFIAGSALDQLLNSTIRLNSPNQLEQCIEISKKYNISEPLTHLKNTVLSYPGNAKFRYSQEIYNILNNK